MECYVRKHDKLVRHLDMCIEEVSREYARVTMPITENHKNGMGVAHGGAIFSLADVAFGCAANAGNDHGVVSLSTTIEYLRPGVVSPLKAEARLVRNGAHVLTYDVNVYDGSGAHVSKCLATGFQTNVPLPR